MNNNLLLIESGKKEYRGFSLEALKNDNINIILASKNKPTWQKKYISDYLEADSDQRDEFIDAAVKYCNEKETIHGVITFVERLVPLAAEVSEALGLRFVNKDIAYGARNKIKMRSIFSNAGLTTPKVLMFDFSANHLPDDFKFPAVVKPVMGFASLNVLKVDSSADLPWVKSVIAKDNHPTLPDPGNSYLIEEYIDGREFSIESVVSDHDIVHYGITEKIISAEPFFEEVAHITPARLSDTEKTMILGVVEKGIYAIGLNNCATHTEIRLSRSRGPVIIETAARLGGDKIPFLVELSTGSSPSLAAGRAALGITIPGGGNPSKHIGIVFFVPAKAAVSSGAVSQPPEIEGIIEFVCSIENEQEVKVPPEQFFTRLGFSIVEGKTYEEVAKRLELVVKYVENASGLKLIDNIMTSTPRATNTVESTLVSA